MVLVQAPWRRRAWEMAKLVGAGFSPFALLIWILLLIGGPEHQDRHGTLVRMDLLAFTYPLGTVLAGALMGIALPAVRRLWVAIPAGILALTPWAFGVSVAVDRGYQHWTRLHTVVSAVIAVVLGAGFGYGFWKARQTDPDVRYGAGQDRAAAAT